MTNASLDKEYFDWIYQLVCGDDKYSKNVSYRKLFDRLYSTRFTYTIDMDENREADGIGLRYRFGYEKGYAGSTILTYLDNRPCSVLEMLVALALRCEEQIMSDQEIGDRTGQWFWNMVVNLGLGSMRDGSFDDSYVDNVVSIFLNREYEPDGRGGLFRLRHCNRDLRSVEIWYQMCWYLDELL